MTLESGESAVAQSASSASERMIERAQDSVVQVRSLGTGAGVIWDGNGLVLTNHHVVARRRRGARVEVSLKDGRTLDAEVVERDRRLDLALLRVKDGPGDLPAVRVGDSNALRVGELVFAIGHPWGTLGAVTAGIVSGLGRVRGSGSTTRYIQSDVSLAPGNSGGPLLNARGEVVGINAMIFGGTAISVPINAASTWLEKRPPRLGVGLLPVELPAPLRRNARTGEVGLVICTMEGNGPADRAGLLVGDVVFGADGEIVEALEDLLDILSRAGETVSLRVARGGAILEIEVEPGVHGPERAA